MMKDDKIIDATFTCEASLGTEGPVPAGFYESRIVADLDQFKFRILPYGKRSAVYLGNQTNQFLCEIIYRLAVESIVQADIEIPDVTDVQPKYWYRISADIDGPVPAGYCSSRIVVDIGCHKFRILPRSAEGVAYFAAMSKDELADNVKICAVEFYYKLLHAMEEGEEFYNHDQ